MILTIKWFFVIFVIYLGNNSFGKQIFDSYYEESPTLDDFPEVCDEYTNENCAASWFFKTNEIMERNTNRLQNAFYRYSSDINKDNLNLIQKLQTEAIKLHSKYQSKAIKFQWKTFLSDRLQNIFKLITTTIESKNETISRNIVDINNQIEFIYNNARPCFKTCLAAGESEIIDKFTQEKDYDKLVGFWIAWRNVTGAKIRDLFINRMELENDGAKENGFKNAGEFNLITDFGDENFKEDVIKLFENLLPFYKELHAYVRYCLAEFYPGKFDKQGPIPAHLFGNVWAQQWTNIFQIIQLCNGGVETNYYQKEVNEKLAQFSVHDMFKLSETFFESIGMYKMTEEFWERSVLEQPVGKIVDCHGSAYDFSNGRDFRILMCTKKDINDFTTIHHEMGHIQYFIAYKNLLSLFQDSANSGFHEAIGDTIALSVKTPEHLKKIGLISNIPKTDKFDIDYLMLTALEKISFIPFSLTISSFMWGIYNGSIPSSQFNEYWWNLRNKYQGIKAPIERSENDFDAGSKYHVAFGVPYIRYFISFIVQFQFYESMCNISGHNGPLHRCDFYQSKEAGLRLLEMLEKGKKQSWKKTLKILTGTENIQTDSLLKYFDPLYKWLKSNNEKLNISVGW